MFQRQNKLASSCRFLSKQNVILRNIYYDVIDGTRDALILLDIFTLVEIYTVSFPVMSYYFVIGYNVPEGYVSLASG
jgi:hypothetical protein